MGEIQNRPFQLSFNAPLKVGFQGSRLTSDGGLILVRELDERLGFGELIEQYLIDSRGKNTQFCFADLLRQSVYSRLAGRTDATGGILVGGRESKMEIPVETSRIVRNRRAMHYVPE
jgi:hypothetical protein